MDVRILDFKGGYHIEVKINANIIVEWRRVKFRVFSCHCSIWNSSRLLVLSDIIKTELFNLYYLEFDIWMPNNMFI